jgi:mRNA-degrading endonuclease HigB of HigAB toxin-antitoxin module
LAKKVISAFFVLKILFFFAGTVAIRFIGTHSEYDRIKDIKNI